MLNPAFTAEAERLYGEIYALPAGITSLFADANVAWATAPERRLGDSHTDDVWTRLTTVLGKSTPWDSLDVADVCSGAGFLAHHLTRKVNPRSLTLIELSPIELSRSKELLASREIPARFVCSSVQDAASTENARFDVVLGNSFLHHFPDLRTALRDLGRLLRPGGLLVALHEPAPMAVSLESGRFSYVAAQLLLGNAFIDRLRYRGPGICVPGAVDIWAVRAAALRPLFEDAGFTDIRIWRRYLLKPVLAARQARRRGAAAPHARGARMSPSAMERLDLALGASRFMPERVFGGFMLSARRN